MKVFWSWQSDHSGKVSRHFVREALEKAISQIKEDPDVTEAARDAELDHDRKGVPGSPDLARIILEKIQNSDVFVADVTPVGNVAGKPKKRLINSNVAIELGYALGAVSDRAMLMILNEAYGTRDELPFDLKHKAGPITYNLPDDATKEQIASEQAKLVGILKVALGEIVVAHAKGLLRPFNETQAAADNPGRYFKAGEVLVRRGAQDLVCLSDHLLYVRVIPSKMQPELGRVEALQLCQEGLRPLDHRSGGRSFEQNRYGALTYETGGDGQILSACQLFKTRELWGFNAYYLSRHHDRLGIPTGCHEATLAFGLRSYLQFAQEKLGVAPPIIVEAGATNIEGHVLFMDQRYTGWEKEWGPIHEANVCVRQQITLGSAEEVDGVLLAVFEQIFDAAGYRRPQRYSGFPGEAVGASPQGH